jgi:hypothetical protein
VCADVTKLSGAAIMLMADEVPRGSVCSTNPVSAQLDDLQYALGEGPGIDAHRDERPVIEPDLATIAAAARWPAFAPGALDAGAFAVYSFPLRVGAVRLGALNLYGERSGWLSDDQYADALVLADVATRAVLTIQSLAPSGVLAPGLLASGEFQFVVHQAAGMVAVQLGVSLAEALLRLRARSYTDDRPLTEIANDVVARRLRFQDEGPDDD